MLKSLSELYDSLRKILVPSDKDKKEQEDELEGMFKQDKLDGEKKGEGRKGRVSERSTDIDMGEVGYRRIEHQPLELCCIRRSKIVYKNYGRGLTTSKNQIEQNH